ncbi:MAG: L-threonylcarbamoyladenylate synthase [Oscillospiraceae bacterium]
MDTLILDAKDIEKSKDDIQTAGKILKNGGLVAIPTETVYGLAADATNSEAVKNIFVAKGRPQDNPLIIHISKKEDAQKYAKDIPQLYYDLCDKFCPGPLTIILKKKDIIPPETSGGLSSVGIRIPSHKAARAIIDAAGTALAAPSANLSGSPSPTTVKRCMDDLLGKVDAIVDGGDCCVGVESTVISLAEEVPTLYRPGFITAEELRAVTGELVIHDGVSHKVSAKEHVPSPGMKYKHYSPKAKVVLVKGDTKSYCDFVNEHISDGVLAMCFESDIEFLETDYVCYGKENEGADLAKNVFECLRISDEKNAEIVYAHCPNDSGISLAVYNRLLRAAAFEVIEV